MQNTVRVAICQISCHPAITSGDIDHEAEPFATWSASPSLSQLARQELDVAGVQRSCRTVYRDWHKQRIAAILKWLAAIKPVPNIVLFPECSIALPLLGPVRDFAIETGATVVAGTHPLHTTDTNIREYKKHGIDSRLLKEWVRNPGIGQSVLPIFIARSSHFRVKAVPSIFEQSDVVRPPRSPGRYDAVPISTAGGQIAVLPLVCSEALQEHAATSAPSLVLIIAYSPNFEHFVPTIQRYITNGVPVALCNDGLGGGSGVFAVADKRAPNWWWAAPIEGRLPKGEALLVADVHLDAVAPQVGIVNPRLPLDLVKLAAVTGDDTRSPSAVAKSLDSIRQAAGPDIRSNLITQVFSRHQPTGVQKLKLMQLKRLADVDDTAPAWWDVLGTDCILMGLPDLVAVEAQMAREVAIKLRQIVESAPDVDDDTLGKLARLEAKCRRAAAGTSSEPVAATTFASAGLASVPIDRDEETKALMEFLGHKSHTVFVLTGLDGVGKSTIVELALGRSGHRQPVLLSLTPDSTPDFIAASVLRYLDYPNTLESPTDAVRALDTPEFAAHVPRGFVLVLYDADNLTSHGQWRDDRTLPVIRSLAKAFASTAGKLILVSAVRLPFDEFDVEHLRRLWLKGLPAEHGALLLDQHLRRAGLNPEDFDKSDRLAVSGHLTGHPGAIILASEYIEHQGMHQVLDDLAKRSGIHAQIVRHILRRLPFTENELQVLSLLNIARVPIPPRLLNTVLKDNAVSIAYDLVECSVLDRVGDRVVLSGLMRGFADLPSLPDHLTKEFHTGLAEHFAAAARASEGAIQLQWAVESQYHAAQCGMPNLGFNVGNLADGLIGAVRGLLRREKEEQAKPVVDDLARLHPTAEVYELAAQVHARLGELEEALTLAKQALSASPSRKWILTEVGRWALHFHNERIAAEALGLAKKVGHETAFMASFEGRLLLREGQFTAGMDALRRAVIIANSDKVPDGWAHYYLGRELLKINEISEAIEVLYKGETLETQRYRPRRRLLVLLRTQLGLAYTFAGDVPNAERVFKLVVDEDPGNAEVARTFAFFRAASGAKDAALRALEDLDPSKARDRYDRCRVYLYRALFLLNLGYRERAAMEFELAHREDPRNVFVLLQWARTLVNMAADADNGGDAEVTRYLAEQAKSVADKVLEFDPDNREALELSERLSDDFNVQ